MTNQDIKAMPIPLQFKYLRTKHKVSATSLSNCCHRTTLNHIESGEQSPSLQLMETLLAQIGYHLEIVENDK